MPKRLFLTNFDHPEGPAFHGHFAPEPPPFDGGVMVVSFNLQFGQQVESAIKEFRTLDPLPEADVIFLQEMDEHGTRAMAEELGLNYVYLPASIHTYHDRPFGNAVLSRWPLLGYQKHILPRLHPLSRQMRIAAGATLDIGGREVTAYSVHTEIYTTTPAHRKEQVAAVAAAASSGTPHVIVGGDFNTVHRGNIDDLDRYFGAAGLRRISKSAGATVKKLGLNIAADHVFARGFHSLRSGTVPARSSDHLPVWVDLQFA